MGNILFEVTSKLNKRIRTTKDYWSFIISLKHLEMEGKEEDVKKTLRDPDFVRVSQDDPNVVLYYRRYGKYFICVVARHLNDEGFLITTYITDKVKEGEEIWKR